MFRCPHCHAESFSIWRKMGAGSTAPASCQFCNRPAYVSQPLIDGIYWTLGSLVLGGSVIIAPGAWWIVPLTGWILMVVRCLLRLIGRLRTTVTYPHETLWRRLWLAGLVLLPILSGIGILFDVLEPPQDR